VSGRERPFVEEAETSVIENGVDTEAFVPRLDARRANTLVFSGNMGYEPNVDAAVWFVEHCLPRIRAAVPDVRLTIAGSRPARAVRQLSRVPGVYVSGFVESMPDVLNESSVAVVPLRSGSGLQDKILEAMACALPIVTTTPALGSIKATSGEELLV